MLCTATVSMGPRMDQTQAATGQPLIALPGYNLISVLPQPPLQQVSHLLMTVSVC